LVENGLEVLSLRIVNLQFHPIEESRLETDWEGTWQAQASREKAAAEAEASQAANRSSQQGTIEYIRKTKEQLKGQLRALSDINQARFLKIKITLHLLLSGTLSIQELTPEVEAGLREILEQTR
jgi:hypothetical protein